MLLLTLIAHIVLDDYITCNAEFEEEKLLRSLEPKSLISQGISTLNVDDTNQAKQPIRIHFDMSSIGNPKNDEQQCAPDQMVKDCQPTTDYLDDAKIASLKETFENVKKFLHENLKIIPLKDPLNLDTRRLSGLKIPDLEEKVKNCDLFIPVVVRPFGAGSSGLAFASSYAYSSPLERPIQGQITINPAKIPTTPQNFTSGQRQFLTTVLHEINHILSFSGSLFDRWKDVNGTKYNFDDDSGVVWQPESSKEYVIEHKYLRTPHLKQWVNERFHVEDNELSKYGLEIEDGGGPGTAGSHPNERLFLTDLMQGRTYGPSYISPLFYNTLLDTGWYEVDEAIIEDMAYLDDTRSQTSRINQTIIRDPPLYSFPEEYLCNSPSATQCFYDHVYIGVCSLVESSKVQESLAGNIAGQMKYYNPTGRKYLGSDVVLDYAPVYLPWVSCRDPSHIEKRYRNELNINTSMFVERAAENFTDRSVCAMSSLTTDFIATGSEPRCYESWCGSDNKVRMVVNGQEKLCKYDYQSLTFSGLRGSLQCPPAGAVCGRQIWVEKREMLNVLSVFPDRGPIEGKNLINLNGFGFDNYPDINLSIGEVNCTIISRKDSYILCQLDELTPEQQKRLVYKQQPLIATIAGKSEPSKLLDMYVFTNRHYDAAPPALGIAYPVAAALLLIGSAIAFFL